MRLLLFFVLTFGAALHGSSQDLEYKFIPNSVYVPCQYDYNQIENFGGKRRHCIDTIAGNFYRNLLAGQLDSLNEVQQNLGYFYYLIYDKRFMYGESYLSEFDTLLPSINKAIEELGFYKLVFALNEVVQCREKNYTLFHSDTTKTMFDYDHTNFDYDFDDVFVDLNTEIHNLRWPGDYLDRLGEYILENRESLGAVK